MTRTVPMLGVNVDHVATIRQARRTFEPDPVTAAALATLGGADIITIHLREDRRHIQDRDVRIMRQTVFTKLNLEMAAADEIVGIALEVAPDQVTLVPERREEVTTEGGLDVVGNRRHLRTVTQRFKEAGITVSLFIDPVVDQVQASADVGADFVELHTGAYANAGDNAARQRLLETLAGGEVAATREGLGVNAGHGLTYHNIAALMRALHPVELHIGHSIVSRAVLVGMERAVREMKDLIHRAAAG